MRALTQPQIDWFLKQDVTIEALTQPDAVTRAEDGALYFPCDTIWWDIKTGKLSGGFCLGCSQVYDAGTYAIDAALVIHEDPLAWLRAGRKGICVADWGQAFEHLRSAPRITLPAALMETYKKHMRPVRMPVVTVAD